MRRQASRLFCASGQSLIEFAIVLPIVMLMVLGVVEVGYALLDEHVVTKLAREGSNLISRDSTLQEAAVAMGSMSSRPVNFNNGSRLVFSVLKRGGTTGTNNFDKLILYQRYEYGNFSAQSVLRTAGTGSFGGPPNYEAANSDNNTSLQITNLPVNLVNVRGGLIYVTEIFSRHDLITPFDRFGVSVPTTLYSIAYF